MPQVNEKTENQVVQLSETEQAELAAQVFQTVTSPYELNNDLSNEENLASLEENAPEENENDNEMIFGLYDPNNPDELINPDEIDQKEDLEKTEEIPIIDENKLNSKENKPSVFQEDRAERTAEKFEKINIPESKDEEGKEYKFTPEEVKAMVLTASYPKLKEYADELNERIETLAKEEGKFSQNYQNAKTAQRAINRNMEFRRLSDVKYLTEYEKTHYILGKDSTPVSDEMIDQLSKITLQALKDSGCYHAGPEDETLMLKHIKNEYIHMNENGMSPVLKTTYQAYNDEKTRKQLLNRLLKDSDQLNYSDVIIEEKRKALLVTESAAGITGIDREQSEKKVERQSETSKIDSNKFDNSEKKSVEITHKSKQENIQEPKRNNHFYDEITPRQRTILQKHFKMSDEEINEAFSNKGEVSRFLEENNFGKSYFNKEKLQQIGLRDSNINGNKEMDYSEIKDKITKVIQLFEKLSVKMEKEDDLSSKEDLRQKLQRFAAEEGYDINAKRTENAVVCSIGDGKFSGLVLGENAKDISKNLKLWADKYRNNLAQTERVEKTKQIQIESQNENISHSENQGMKM